MMRPRFGKLAQQGLRPAILGYAAQWFAAPLAAWAGCLRFASVHQPRCAAPRWAAVTQCSIARHNTDGRLCNANVLGSRAHLLVQQQDHCFHHQRKTAACPRPRHFRLLSHWGERSAGPADPTDGAEKADGFRVWYTTA